MSDFEVFEVPNFLLQKGGVLPTARLAYATRGTLNTARDNAVLVPSWYTGTHDDSATFMLGESRALDPDKYFIIRRDWRGDLYKFENIRGTIFVINNRFHKELSTVMTTFPFLCPCST